MANHAMPLRWLRLAPILRDWHLPDAKSVLNRRKGRSKIFPLLTEGNMCIVPSVTEMTVMERK